MITYSEINQCTGAGRAGSEAAFSLLNKGFFWLLRGDRRSSARDGKDFRKPMLYPLSYEGLPCTFIQHAGRSVTLRTGATCPTTVPHRYRLSCGQLLTTA